MITRHFQKEDATSSAIYSDCETYRYALTRVWDDARPRVLFIMLNPSKATEQQNDPTIERCERRARRSGRLAWPQAGAAWARVGRLGAPSGSTVAAPASANLERVRQSRRHAPWARGVPTAGDGQPRPRPPSTETEHGVRL